jgi:hypothetical protein
MRPRWRCHVPRTARHAVFGHMSGCDLENQSWLGPIKLQVPRNGFYAV